MKNNVIKKRRLFQIIASSLLLFGALIFFVEIFTPIRVYAPIYNLFIDSNIPIYKYIIYLIVNIYIIALFLLAVITFVLTLLNHKYAAKMLYITLLTFALMTTMLTISQIVYSVSMYHTMYSSEYHKNYLKAYIYPININNGLITIAFIFASVLIAFLLKGDLNFKNKHLYRLLSALPLIIFIIPSTIQLIYLGATIQTHKVFASDFLPLAIYAFFLTWLAFYHLFGYSKDKLNKTLRISLSFICIPVLLLFNFRVFSFMIFLHDFFPAISETFLLHGLPHLIFYSILALAIYANALISDIAKELFTKQENSHSHKLNREKQVNLNINLENSLDK